MPAGSCPACGGALHYWRTVPCFEPALGSRSFALWRCAACGTAVTDGQAPPELHDSGAYGPQTPRLHALARPILRAFDAQRLAFLRPYLSAGAALLDVGAGRGRFVAAAGGAGYRASGIEPSNRGVAAARALGAEVAQAGVLEAQIEPGTLDAASVWHVLEHLDEPRAALERIATWLRPGGVLLVGVPNLSSFQARLGAERWYHLDVPRHRTHFTARGIETLIEGCGFRVARTHHVLLEQNPFGLWQSLVSRFTATPSYLYNLLKRNASWRSRDLAITLAALPVIPLAALVELGAGLAGRGGTVAVVAIREE